MQVPPDSTEGGCSVGFVTRREGQRRSRSTERGSQLPERLSLHTSRPRRTLVRPVRSAPRSLVSSSSRGGPTGRVLRSRGPPFVRLVGTARGHEAARLRSPADESTEPSLGPLAKTPAGEGRGVQSRTGYRESTVPDAPLVHSLTRRPETPLSLVFGPSSTRTQLVVAVSVSHRFSRDVSGTLKRLSGG